MFTNKKMLSRIEGCFKLACWYWLQGSDPQCLTSRLFIIDYQIYGKRRDQYTCVPGTAVNWCVSVYELATEYFFFSITGIIDRRFIANFKSIQKSVCLGRGDWQSHALGMEGWVSEAADFSISHWSMAELFIFWFPTHISCDYTFVNRATNRIWLF